MIAPLETATAKASLAFDALIGVFWNQDTQLFDIRTPNTPASYDLSFDLFHYWWQAHALDALVDAFERDGNILHLERGMSLLAGLQLRNGGLTNDYYDDMEWLALSCLRAFDASQKTEFKTAALKLWDDIKTGWNQACGGGIAWRKSQLDYKNTPANAPAIILAARLFQRFGNAQDLNWATRIYSWLEDHLIDHSTGFVWDGMNRQGDFAIDKDWAFTYCQGVMIGAALEMYAITRRQTFLEQAKRTAEAARLKLSFSSSAAMPDEGAGDAGLFKGILVRYLRQFVEITNDHDSREWLMGNARLAWANRDSQQHLFGQDWTAAPIFPLDLSTQLSGVFLLEAASKLERQIK